MKILIVEDNFYIAGKILIQLDTLFENTKKNNNYISVLPNLTETGLLLEDNKYTFDLLLLDHDLPDGNGTWILRNYKNRFKYIIAISAIFENNKRLIECGADYHIQKMEKDFYKRLTKLIKTLL